MHIVPNVLPGSSVVGIVRTSLHLLKEGHNHPIGAYLCHMIGEELVFLIFLCIKLFELGVEVAFNHRSAVTHNKANLLKFPLRGSRFERTDDTFVLLLRLSPLGTPRPYLSTVQILTYIPSSELH